MNEYQRRYRQSEWGKQVHKSIKDRHRALYKDRINAHNREYRKLNRDRIIKERLVKHIILKFDVLSHYADGDPTCKICGENRLPCLSIDHMEGGGNQHRKSVVGGGGHKFYAWLKRNYYPEGFQVLCMNCQFMKG